MSKAWPLVKLGEVLEKSQNWINLDAQKEYKEVTVRLWGKGVTLRGMVTGSQIAGSRRLQVHSNQFILSRIDARNGAFGLIPDELDNAVVSNDFPVFDIHQNRLLQKYLHWLSKTKNFVESCKSVSEGTTNRVRLKEDKFSQIEISLPPLAEQQRIVAKIERLAGRIEEAITHKKEIVKEYSSILHSIFNCLTKDSPMIEIEKIAPLIRRAVTVCMEGEYPELGIKSFGKGTFHKPALNYLSIGNKRLYRIEPGDLVFNNVFAWEGAIAVAQPNDIGKFGSHRFITCVAKQGISTANFICFYLLTPEGLNKIGEASPGGAGRNRTLGLEKLTKIQIPLPDYKKQLYFDRLQSKVKNVLSQLNQTENQLRSMLPSILDKAFKGEL